MPWKYVSLIGNDEHKFDKLRKQSKGRNWNVKNDEPKFRLKENISPLIFWSTKIARPSTLVEKLKKKNTRTRSSWTSSTKMEQIGLPVSNFKKEGWEFAHLWWLQNRCKRQNLCRLISYVKYRMSFELPCGHESIQ